MIELDVSKNKTLIFDCEVQDMVNCKAALHQMQALYGEIYGLMLLKMAQKYDSYIPIFRLSSTEYDSIKL